MPEPLPRLPLEIVNYIVDFLRYDRKTLERCCLLSKSWIPLARRHLFKEIKLCVGSDLGAWGKHFPDPARSPAHHARSLDITVFKMSEDESGWIKWFTRVTRFTVWVMESEKLSSFHKFSPVLKSLCVPSTPGPSSDILALVCSFPFLEDLEVSYFHDVNQDGAAFRPPSSPVFTGTLILGGHLEPITTRMLDLPGGLHFKEIVWNIHCNKNEEPDIWWMVELTERCFDTLEHIEINFTPLCVRLQNIQIDLSKAKKLKGVRIRLSRGYATWMARLLETITSDNKYLERIEISLPVSVDESCEWETFGQEQCKGLDNILVLLWESHAIRTRFAGYSNRVEWNESLIRVLFPQVSKRLGLV